MDPILPLPKPIDPNGENLQIVQIRRYPRSIVGDRPGSVGWENGCKQERKTDPPVIRTGSIPRLSKSMNEADLGHSPITVWSFSATILAFSLPWEGAFSPESGGFWPPGQTGNATLASLLYPERGIWPHKSYFMMAM